MSPHSIEEAALLHQQLADQLIRHSLATLIPETRPQLLAQGQLHPA